MPFYLTPHSSEWFKALESFDPSKAAITKMIIETMGNIDVCSNCGDDPAQDYQLIGLMQKNAVATIRLCDDCLRLRRRIYQEKFIPYKPIEK